MAWATTTPSTADPPHGPGRAVPLQRTPDPSQAPHRPVTPAEDRTSGPGCWHHQGVPSNEWNLLAYRAWAPVYDLLFQRLARPGRVAAARALAVRPGETVLVVGVGTGQDLDLLPAGARVVGVDLSQPMLARADARARARTGEVGLLVGDAGHMPVATGMFDAAILGLVLSVVPDPVAALRETMRALRPGGRAVVFDKFAPDTGPLGLGRRLLNPVTKLFGTEIDRRLPDLVATCPCTIEASQASILGGHYRVVRLRRGDDRWPA